MKSYRLLAAAIAVTLLAACAPKVTEPVVTGEKPAAPVAKAPAKPMEEKLSPCPKFSDAPNPDEAETNYVLYRDFMRANQWDKAYELWKKVYDVAPAADGRRNTVYADGITFLERFISQTQDSLKREGYINRIFALYDEIDKCYGEGGAYAPARKAFDLYYKYPYRASPEEIYAMFKEAIDRDGLETPDFVLNPFTALLVDLYFQGKIPEAEAKKYQQLVRDILAKGLADCEGKSCERWKIIEQYVPVRLESFETVKGFYDCSYYLDKYYGDFLAASTDCDTIRAVYSWLKWGDCAEDSEAFQRLIAAGNENCRVESTGPLSLGYDCLRNADYNCAIENFQKAADETSDPEKKGQYLLLIAKVYDAHFKNYPRSRQYALQAAAVRPNWGEPYIHIGRLYASSGPLCGPGRGWDSQVVVWPAIDMWTRAKQVDPSVAGEANKWIGRYSQYMPSREDIFQRNLNEGDAFRVGCWIQETTRIRAAN